MQAVSGSADGGGTSDPGRLHLGASSLPVPLRDVLPEPQGSLLGRPGLLALELPRRAGEGMSVVMTFDL